jgi:hypothetical protein
VVIDEVTLNRKLIVANSVEPVVHVVPDCIHALASGKSISHDIIEGVIQSGINTLHKAFVVIHIRVKDLSQGINPRRLSELSPKINWHMRYCIYSYTVESIGVYNTANPFIES